MPFKNLFKCLQRQDPEDFFDVEDFMITRIIPVEIMEFVFVELSIKDIRSCLRTCIRWNHIIHAMFKNKSKSTHLARIRDPTRFNEAHCALQTYFRISL